MVPFAIDVLAAVIVMDCNVAAVTLRAIVFEVTPPWVAVMLLDPVPAPVAIPVVPIVATDVFDEAHVAEFVKFWVVPSLNVPVAAKSSAVPFAMEVVAAVMVIDWRVAAVTVNAIAFEVIPFCAAVTLLEPTATPVATPLVLIVTAAAFDEVHVAEFVRF